VFFCEKDKVSQKYYPDLEPIKVKMKLFDKDVKELMIATHNLKGDGPNPLKDPESEIMI
jgi:hypothetical protein